MKEPGKHIDSSPVSVNPEPGKPTVWLDDQDIMQRLHMSKGTIRNLRKTGLLPFHKIGRKIYYDESDFMEMMRKNRHTKYPARQSK
jgi:hypothetical protein